MVSSVAAEIASLGEAVPCWYADRAAAGVVEVQPGQPPQEAHQHQEEADHQDWEVGTPSSSVQDLTQVQVQVAPQSTATTGVQSKAATEDAASRYLV